MTPRMTPAEISRLVRDAYLFCCDEVEAGHAPGVTPIDVLIIARELRQHIKFWKRQLPLRLPEAP